MSALGKLVCAVALDAAEFVQGADRAKYTAASLATDVERQLKGLERSVVGIVGGIGAALAAGFTVSALKGAFDSYVEGAAKLKDLATQAGTTVEKLGSLAPAAKLSGTAMEDVAAAMGKLAKSAVEADDKTSAQARAFARLQIETRGANGTLKDTGDLMLEVAKKLDEYQDGTGKTVIAQQLLGKSGAQLIPFMKELAEVGAVNSTITAKQAAMAKDYSDQLVKLSVAKGAVVKIISSELLPVADAFVRTLVEMNSKTGGMKDKARELAEDGSIRRWAMYGIESIGFLIDMADGAKRTFEAVGEYIGFLAARAVNTIGGLATAARLFVEGEYTKAWQAMKDTTTRDGEIVEAHAESMRAKFEKPLAGTAFVESVRANLAKIDEGVAATSKKTLDATSSAKQQITELDKALQDVLGKLSAREIGVSPQFFKDMGTLNAAFLTGKISIAEFTAAQAQLRAMQPDVVAGFKEQTKALEDLKAIDQEVQKEVDALIMKYDQLAKSRLQGVDDAIERAKIELDVMGKSNVERAVALLQFEKEKALRGIIDEQIRESIELKYQELELSVRSRAAREAEINTWGRLGDAAGSFFADLVMNGRSAFDRLRDQLKQLAADLLAFFAKKWFLQMVAGVAGGESALGQAANGAVNGMGNSLMGTALTAANQWGGSMIGASTFTGGVSSAVWGTGALTGAGDFVGTGLAGMAGEMALAAGATDAFAATVAAAVPVIGWIVAIAAALYAIFGNKGGGDKVGASSMQFMTADGLFTHALVPGSDNGRFFTPNQYDSALSPLVRATGQGYRGMIQQLGGTAEGFGFGLGFDHDPRGSAQSRVSSMLTGADGRVIYRQQDMNMDDKAVPEALQLESRRMILAALQASELPQAIAVMLDSVVASTASKEQIDQVLAGALAIKSIFDIAARDPMGDLATAIDESMNKLDTALRRNDTAVRNVAKAYDGSATSAVALAQATAGYYNAQMQLLAQVQELRSSLGDLFGNTIRNFKLGGMDNQGKYNFYQEEAARLQQEALSSTDPETIRRLAARINADMEAAFNLLSDEQKAGAEGREFISRGEATAKALDDHLKDIQKGIVDATKGTLEDIKKIIEDNAKAQQAAADTQRTAADTNLAAARTPRTFLLDLSGGTQQVTTFD